MEKIVWLLHIVILPDLESLSFDFGTTHSRGELYNEEYWKELVEKLSLFEHLQTLAAKSRNE